MNKTTTNPGYQSGQGAVWEIRTVPGDALVDTLTAGPSGLTNPVDVLPGDYRAVETSAPAGQTTHAPINFTTTAAGGDIDLTAVNSVTQQAALTLRKVDAIGGSELAGAGYAVRRDGNNDGVYGTDDPAASVGGPNFAGTGPYGPGPDGTWGTGDDYAPLLTADGVIPGPGPDGVYGTGDDNGLWYSTGNPSLPTGLGPVWAGDMSITETVQPAGYQPPAPGPGPDGIWGNGDDDLPGDYTTQYVSLGHNTVTDVVFSNKRILGLNTQAVQTGTNLGDPVSDRLTVNGLLDGETATAALEVYGPYDPATPVGALTCQASERVHTATFGITGSGEHVSPEFRLYEPGLYTMMVNVSTVDGRTVSHACGEPAESFRLLNVTTKASTATIAAGGEVRDTVIVEGLAAGETASVTVTLHGPFDVNTPSAGTFADLRPTQAPDGSTVAPVGVTPWVCAAESAQGTVTFDVTGSGEHQSPPITVGEAGSYSFVESLTLTGSTAPDAAHPCGLTEESLRSVSIDTKVSANRVTAGDGIRDIGIVDGLRTGEAATIHVALYGPFDSADAIKCETPVASSAYGITGSGEHPSPEITVARPGIYTFVETLELATGEKISHGCGLSTETFTATSSAASAGQMARTGSNTSTLLTTAVAVLLLGIALVASSAVIRRRN